jgi:MFS family permease
MTAAALGPGRLIHVLFAIQLVSMGALEMSGPFWPLHLKAVSASSFEFGLASVAVYVGPMLGTVLTSAFWGRVGDRTGHKLMMIRALIGLSLTQFALAWAHDVWTILALRCLQGACAGFIAPAQTYGVAIVAPSGRARLFAYLQVSTNIGSLIGAVSGGAILDHATFAWINIVAGLLCMGCAAAVTVALPDVRPRKPDASAGAQAGDRSAGAEACATHADDAPRSWRSSPIPGLLGVIGILLMSRTLTQTPFSLYMRSTFGVDNWIVGFCYGMLSLGFVVSASLWARYFERHHALQSLQRMGYIALACAGLALAAALTREIALFVALHLVWGILLGATTPVLMSLISKAAGSTRQGYVLGVARSACQLASVIGIALGGWLSSGAGLHYTYFFVAASYAFAVLVISVLRRESVFAPRAVLAEGAK